MLRCMVIELPDMEPERPRLYTYTVLLAGMYSSGGSSMFMHTATVVADSHEKGSSSLTLKRDGQTVGQFHYVRGWHREPVERPILPPPPAVL